MNDSELARAVEALRSALETIKGQYMLIGGLAVVLRGFPRHTDDIDIAVLGSGTSIERLAKLLTKGGFEPRIDDAVAFAEQSQVLLFRHRDTAIELDVSLAWLPFEKQAIAAAELIDVEGIQIPVARVEDLLIYKAIAWRDRDQRDIRELVSLYRAQVDLARVRDLVEQFSEAMDTPERVSEFERLIGELDDN